MAAVMGQQVKTGKACCQPPRQQVDGQREAVHLDKQGHDDGDDTGPEAGADRQVAEEIHGDSNGRVEPRAALWAARGGKRGGLLNGRGVGDQAHVGAADEGFDVGQDQHALADAGDAGR